MSYRAGSSGLDSKPKATSNQNLKTDLYSHVYSSSMVSSPKMHIHTTVTSTPITKNFNSHVKHRHPSMIAKNISKLKSRPNTSQNSNANYTVSQTHVSDTNKISTSNPKKCNRQTSPKSPQGVLGFNISKNLLKTNVGIKTSL